MLGNQNKPLYLQTQFSSIMKRLSLLLLCSAIASISLAQNPVNETTARKIATQFTQQQMQKTTAEITLFSATGIYVYNVGDQGFVIVSGNDVLPPILGYSKEAAFPSLDDAPENVTGWIRHYEDMIDYATENHIAAEPAIQAQWQAASRGEFGAKGVKTVDPLVETHWNQDCFYNSLCPYTGGSGWWDDGGPCGHAYAGCVACAMAQVMKYWNHPAQGFGSHSYNHSTYGIQSANFGETTYQWNQMPNSIYWENDAIATLMYHCGVSVNMNYGPGGSGAQSKDVETALRSYFGYCGVKYREKSKFDEDSWIAMLKADLDLAHPLYYSGSSSSAGHAFVCDGYDNNNLFHFNFGWSGAGDANYSLYDVNGYSGNQAAVFNIVPMDIRPDENGIIYVSADGEGNGTSWEQATHHLAYATYLSSGGENRVWVKKGTYYGDDSDPENAFYITSKDKIYGGFNGDEGPDYDLSQRDFVNNASILDGQGVKRVLNQEELLNSANKALWDGFTLRNGHAGSGGGVYINGYVTLDNCVFEDNSAEGFGGGVYVNASSNSSTVFLNNCKIIHNNASMGAGLCDRDGATLTNCVIANNTASTKGGGVYTYYNATPKLRGCIIANNTAIEGGGVYSRGKCQFINCDIVMNEASESAGGCFNEKSQNSYTSSILWGNVANGNAQQNVGDCTFQYCAVQGGMEGVGNIDIAAENTSDGPGYFVRFHAPSEGPGANYDGGNWKISSRSICLNAGKDGTAGYSTDLAGSQRIQHGRIDIGAYERNASLTQIEASIWENETYWFNGMPLHEPGYYATVYPTPTCDSVVGLTLQVTLATEEATDMPAEIHSVEVFSLLGHYLGTVKDLRELSTERFSPGCYLLRMHTSEGIKNEKVVIH